MPFRLVGVDEIAVLHLHNNILGEKPFRLVGVDETAATTNDT